MTGNCKPTSCLSRASKVSHVQAAALQHNRSTPEHCHSGTYITNKQKKRKRNNKITIHSILKFMICRRRITVLKLKFHLKSIWTMFLRVYFVHFVNCLRFYFQILCKFACWKLKIFVCVCLFIFSRALLSRAHRKEALRSWLFSKLWQIETINYLRNNSKAETFCLYAIFHLSRFCINGWMVCTNIL